MNNPPIAGYKHALYPNGSVTQWFAMNPKRYGAICVTDLTMPQDEYCMSGHNGIDIVAPWGTPLLAVVDGYIAEVNNSPAGYGKHVRLMSVEDGGYVDEWIYGHCSEILVKPGQFVKAGQVIAKMGNTGFVVSGATPFWKNNPYAGTHVHLGKRRWKLNPSRPIKYALQGEVVNYYNGYFGYVDYQEELGKAAGFEYVGDAAFKLLTLKSLYNEYGRLFALKRG